MRSIVSLMCNFFNNAFAVWKNVKQCLSYWSYDSIAYYPLNHFPMPFDVNSMKTVNNSKFQYAARKYSPCYSQREFINDFLQTVYFSVYLKQLIFELYRYLQQLDLLILLSINFEIVILQMGQGMMNLLFFRCYVL